MDILSILIGIGGCLISICALVKAQNAQRAARDATKRVLDRFNADEDLQLLRDLHKVLETAKNAVMPWRESVLENRRSGRLYEDDLENLSIAADAIRTKAPLSIDDQHKERILETADKLETAYQTRSDLSKTQGNLQEVVSELQRIMTMLKSLERDMRDDRVLT